MNVGYLILYTPVIILLVCLIISFLPSDRKSSGGLFFVILSAVITSVSAVEILSGSLFDTNTYGTWVFSDVSLRIEHLHHVPQEVSLVMRLPQFVIIEVMLSIGLFPQYYFQAVSQRIGVKDSILDGTVQLMSAIGRYSLKFI